MKIKNGSADRCGIFLYYDRQGMVDEYVMYLLESLRPFLKHLLIVCNGEVNEDAEAKFNSVADEVMTRVNEGFDVGGYRDGIFHIGFEKLTEYDETILFNYTFFGPLYPFKEMFDKMDGMDVDFWGITRHYKVDPDPYGVNRYGYLPEHIQSHFMALRKDFIGSNDYIDFITRLKNPGSYIESICEYETIFTKHFEDLGYRWDTYVDTSDYIGYSYCPVMFYLKDMIENKRCPIVKRRSFFTDYNDFMLNTCGESSVDAYEYIRDNLDYDLNMVWDNILRLENMTEISRVMHFNYMLPAYEAYEIKKSHKPAVFVYVESPRHFGRYIKYINNIPDYIKLFYIGTEDVLSEAGINTDVDETGRGGAGSYGSVSAMDTMRDYGVALIVENRYMSAFRKLEERCSDYDIAAFMVISDVEVEKPYSNYDSWQYRDWENLLGTRCVIENVIASFDENERLGMLAPPVPYHGILFEKQADGWQGLFDGVSKYLEQAGCNVNHKISEPPQAPFGGSFWIRTDAVDRWSGRCPVPESSVFKMALVYLVQEMGYYSGVCYNNEYAAIETSNYDYMMRELNKAVFEKYGPNYLNVVVNRINNNEFLAGEHVAGRREKLKHFIVTAAQKLLPRKLYVMLRLRYMKMRGWI